MRNRILTYSHKIADLLSENSDNTNWSEVLDDLLIQIGFFQHERLIHLIVTVTFAVLEILSVCLALILENFASLLLSVMILCLLIPYIRHYYLLENEVQKMYTFYDEIRLKMNFSEK